MTFTVTLQPSGRSYRVEGNAKILDAGLEAGLNMPYSCRAGNCKTCRSRVVQGEVDHGSAHGAYLTAQQKADGYALLCCARPRSDLVIEVDELVLERTKPKLVPCRIKRMHRPASDVAVLELRLPMNENLMFAAGQYIDFQLPGNITRSYSIASAPSTEGVIDLELHVRHRPGGFFTDRIFEGVEGQLMQIKAPLGSFYLREDSSKPIIFVVTGTGFAPVKSMVNYAVRKGINRPMFLYWGARNQEGLYMDALAREWAEALHLEYIPVISKPAAAEPWGGRTGYVHDAVMQDHPDLAGFQVYACGSPAMVDAARSRFVQEGNLPENEFFADAFVTELERTQWREPLQEPSQNPPDEAFIALRRSA